MNTLSPLKLVATITLNIYSDGQNYTTEIAGIEKVHENKVVEHLFTFWKKVIKDYWDSDSFGTSKISENAMRSFQRFNKKLEFTDVTPELLRKYENYMMGKREDHDKSVTTLIFYLQALRRVLNLAKKAKIITGDMYPFGEDKYKIPSGRTIKRAIDVKVLSTFIKYEPELTKEKQAHALWKFSFFGNGMNMRDVFNLKYENIDGDFFFFYREKTFKKTKTKKEPVTVFITPELKKIIEIYGNKKRKGYIFNILNDRMSKEEKYVECLRAVRKVNYSVKKVCRRISIKENITTYVARHSWATTLLHKGVPVAYISKGMGHASIMTTENYLAGFTDSDQIKFGKLLYNVIFK